MFLVMKAGLDLICVLDYFFKVIAERFLILQKSSCIHAFSFRRTHHRTFFCRFYNKFENLGGSIYEPIKLLPFDIVISMPCLAANPLRARIAEVFCDSFLSDEETVEWSFDNYRTFFIINIASSSFCSSIS